VCANFAAHAREAISFDGITSTIHGGDVGVAPGTAITGSVTFDDGEVVADSTDFAASVLAAHTAAMTVGLNEQHMEIEMGGLTFEPGTYRSESAINFAHGTTVTLDGEGEYIFIAESTLVTAANTYFILLNGAKAENILWALGSAATLGADSVVEGSILAGSAITFGSRSVLHGCALADSAITFESEGSIVLKAVDICPHTSVFNVLGGVGNTPSIALDILFDLEFTGTSIKPTVDFKINNPFDSSADSYVQFHRGVGVTAGGFEEDCSAQLNIGKCNPSSDTITAACTAPPNGQAFAVVTVFFVSNDLALGGGGGEVDKCCHQEASTIGTPVVEYTFSILCGCPETSRNLRGVSKV
jgi:hypothetical protein